MPSMRCMPHFPLETKSSALTRPSTESGSNGLPSRSRISLDKALTARKKERRERLLQAWKSRRGSWC